MRPAVSTPTLIARAAHCYSATDEQRDVFESHRHHVFSVAYYMTGDEQEAETILESSFVEAFTDKVRPSIEDLDRALMGQLHQRLSFEAVEPVSAGTDPSAGLAAGNVRRTDLEEALWQLPVVERLCFILRDVEGYPVSRAAELLQASESEFKRTLFSARLRMRNLLLEARTRTLVDA